MGHRCHRGFRRDRVPDGRAGTPGKTPEDKQSDFARGYDFEEAFVRNFDWLDKIGRRQRLGLE